MPQRWRNSQFLLGIEGLALLRAWLTGNEDAISARVREIEGLCRQYRDAGEENTFEAEDVGVSTAYASLATTYDEFQNPLIAAEEPHVRGLLDGLRKGSVVDVACGTGRHTKYLADLGHHVTGVDVVDAMLAIARDKVPHARFVRGDAEALPLATNSHDAAVCALALAHLTDLRPALTELTRVVRPGGNVILSDIHPFAAITGANVAVLMDEERLGVLRNEFHPHSRYLDAFSASGLRVETCIEPLWDTTRYGRGGVLETILEATAMALDGLPFALIWHLRAERRS